MYVVKVVKLRTAGKCCHDRPGLTRNAGPAGNLSLVLKLVLSADRRLIKGWDWRRHRPGLTRNAGPVCALSLVGKEVGWRKYVLLHSAACSSPTRRGWRAWDEAYSRSTVGNSFPRMVLAGWFIFIFLCLFYGCLSGWSGVSREAGVRHWICCWPEPASRLRTAP